MTDSLPGLRYDVNGAVARLVLARPARRNALDCAGWTALAAHCAALAANANIRIVRLEAEGGHFCAGADISELSANIRDARWMKENQRLVGEALDAWAALPQPTLAVVQGSCYGGGLALALSADFRIATADSRFAITPARLGLSYRLVDCKRVVDAVGHTRARELLLAARELDAETALDWGVIGALVEATDLAATVDAKTAALLALSGQSQRAIKANLNKIRDGATLDDLDSQAAFAAAFASADFAEGAAAFLAKRPPRFDGPDKT